MFQKLKMSMSQWTNNEGTMKALLFRASDLNRGIERVAPIELTDLNSLRLLLMQTEVPVIMGFASEHSMPAEIEIVIYDDAIEKHEDLL